MRKKKNFRVFITDYITNPSIEKKILGKNLINNENKFDSEIILVWHHECDSEYLSKFKNLKLIVRYGVGVDNIDLEYCELNKIKVANTPDYGVDEVSDTALAMILYFVRSIGWYNNKIKKNFGGWQLEVNQNIKRGNETNIGIIGFGRIGKRLSQKLSNIGFNCFYYDPNVNIKCPYSKKIRSLKKLLKDCDVISINSILNNSTKELVDIKFLRNMRKNAILINTARGKIIKNLSIISDHLKKNKNFSVGLDVLPVEPPPIKNSLIKLWKNNYFDGRLIINPHTAYFSTRSIISMREKASLNAKLFIQNRKIRNRIV